MEVAIDDTGSVASISGELEELNVACEESKNVRTSAPIKEKDSTDDIIETEDHKMRVLRKGIGEPSMPNPPDD